MSKYIKHLMEDIFDGRPRYGDPYNFDDLSNYFDKYQFDKRNINGKYIYQNYLIQQTWYR